MPTRTGAARATRARRVTRRGASRSCADGTRVAVPRSMRPLLLIALGSALFSACTDDNSASPSKDPAVQSAIDDGDAAGAALVAGMPGGMAPQIAILRAINDSEIDQAT